MAKRATAWSLFGDEELDALEDALAYATACSRDNYGMGYDRSIAEDREARRMHRQTERLLGQVTKERERRGR